MAKNFKLKIVFLFSLLSVSITLLFIVSSWVTRTKEIENYRSALVTVLNTSIETLNYWADERADQVNAIKKANILKGFDAASNEKRKILFERLNEFVQSYSHEDIKAVILFDASGRLLYPDKLDDIDLSSERLKQWAAASTDASDPEFYFTSPEPIIIQQQDRAPGIAMIDIMRGSSESVYLGLILDLTKNFSKITQLGRLRITGETYAVDQAGVMISQSRFDDMLIKINLLSANQINIGTIRVADPGVNLVSGSAAQTTSDRWPLTRITEVLTRTMPSNVVTIMEAYRDYRGIPVFGAGIWLPKLKMGLITEMDEAEAFSTYYQQTWISILGLLIIIATIILLGIVIVRLQTKSINSDLRVQAISQASHEPIFITDSFENTIFFNSAAERLSGRSREGLFALKFSELFQTPLNQSQIRNHLASLLNNPSRSSENSRLEMRIPINSEVRWFDILSAPFSMEGETFVVSTFRDVTDQKQSTRKLREFRQLLDEVQDMIFVAEFPTYRIRDANQQAFEKLGYTREELLELTFSEIDPEQFPKSSTADNLNEVNGAFKATVLTKFLRKDQKVIPIELNMSLAINEDQVSIVGLARDLTERLEVEKQQIKNSLMQTQKMVSLGQLAGGLAHEINTPLAAISAYFETLTEMVGNKFPKDQDVDFCLEGIEKNRKRVIKIIDQLKTFGRKSQSQTEIVEVDHFVAECIALVEGVFKGAGIEIIVQTLDHAAHIAVDQNQMEQVLLNLIVNARDAVNKSERKCIKVVAAEREDHTVSIFVEDSGPGVPSEIRDRIFEPFFTTKNVGQGMGLGLSISYTIVKDFQGKLLYKDSLELGGACFEVNLPKVS